MDSGTTSVAEAFARACSKYGWAQDDFLEISDGTTSSERWPQLLASSSGEGNSTPDFPVGISDGLSNGNNSSAISHSFVSSGFDDEEDALTAQLELVDLGAEQPADLPNSSFIDNTDSSQPAADQQTLSPSRSVDPADFDGLQQNLSPVMTEHNRPWRARRRILADDSFEAASPKESVSSSSSRSKTPSNSQERGMWNSIEQLLESSSDESQDESQDVSSLSHAERAAKRSVSTDSLGEESVDESLTEVKTNEESDREDESFEELNDNGDSSESSFAVSSDDEEEEEECLEEDEEDEEEEEEEVLSNDSFESEQESEQQSATKPSKNGIVKKKSWSTMSFKDLCSATSMLSGLAFARVREKLGNRLFAMLNEELNGALPQDLPLVWSKSLNTTAGRTKYTRKQSNGVAIKAACIELGTKVLDDSKRLTFTLAHEMCHAAVWLVDGEASDGPHGKAWRAWAQRVTARVPCIKISTRHDYNINFKFMYECTGPSCSAKWGRHSKSIDVTRQRCGKCGGSIALRDSAPERKPTAFNSFTKAHFGQVQEANPQWNFGEVSKHVAALYRQQQRAQQPA